MERGITGNERTDPTVNCPAAAGIARSRRAVLIVAVAPVVASCSGIQSALDPAGEEAGLVATLFWVMTVGATVIWAFVVLLALYAARWKRAPISDDAAGRIILWAGVAFPVAVLTALLCFALWLMPSLRPFAGSEQTNLRVEIVGRQFWWHVVYRRPDGSTVVSANEVRLPMGQRVEFSLESRDMIHSFWIPALGGKMDLIPGRTNRLSLRATRSGIYRGQCAEFCGTSHALMAFPAVVMEQEEFDLWLEQRGVPSEGLAPDHVGRKIFLREGCGDCHRVDGTEANGTAGPDLSHIGSRLTIGAGLLGNDVENLNRFIFHSASVKPGSRMPPYPDLSTDELHQIASWLKGLR